MIVRCGVCRNQFEVPGPGRYGCPSCGSANQVGGGSSARPGGDPTAPGAIPPPETVSPPPPAPEMPSPRIACPVCEFTFIVGNIALATCPNCGEEVETGRPGTPDPYGIRSDRPVQEPTVQDLTSTPTEPSVGDTVIQDPGDDWEDESGDVR